MGHYPVNPSFSVPSNKGMIVYQGRVDMSRISPTTVTPLVGGAFTVPVLFGSVTINVSSSASFAVNDTICIGERLGAFTSPAVPSNPVAFTAWRTGSWLAGTNVQTSGYRVISPNGSRTTVTTAAWTIPVFSSPTAISGGLNVATPASVQGSARVIITNYAGVYVVTAKPSATSMTVKKVVEGDLIAGETCIAGNTTSLSGTPIAQGTFLGTVPNIATTQFFPLDVWYAPISQVAPAGSGLVIGVGWSANANSGRDALSDITRSFALNSGSMSTSQYTRLAISTSNLSQRLAANWGLPIFACQPANTGNAGSGTVMSVTVRGFLSEIS